eukprot:6763027-Alexandrium_andersonii.AAC.1
MAVSDRVLIFNAAGVIVVFAAALDDILAVCVCCWCWFWYSSIRVVALARVGVGVVAVPVVFA